MPAPGDEDVSFDDKSAAELLLTSDKESSVVWAYGALTEVKRNLLSTGYHAERIFFVKGKVEETIPLNAIPPRIAPPLAIGYAGLVQRASRHTTNLSIYFRD